MPVLYVASAEPLSGKTTIAVGLAAGLAEAHVAPVQLARTGASDAAAADAETFASFAFASSPGKPVAPASLPASKDEVLLAEADAGDAPAGATVLVVRAALDEADIEFAKSLGKNLFGSFATLVPPAAIEDVARRLNDAGLRPLALLPEDPALAAPDVAEIRDALHAEVLYDAENWRDTTESLVVSPIYTDPARPHFRRYDSKAILAPHNKTDLLLSAIESGAACVVVTGGQEPSPYVLNRAQGETTTLLLARQRTPEAVAALADVFSAARFRGERKAAAVLALLRDRIDFPAFAKKLV